MIWITKELSIIWDAFQAVIRGRLISWNNIERKTRNENLDLLQRELIKTQSELEKRPGKKKLEKRIRLLQEQINTFENQEMLWAIKKLQQKYFDGANKSGKFLAQQLKVRKERKLINRINEDKKEINDEKGIWMAFLKFYSNLYKEKKLEVEKIEDYFKKVEMKKLKEEKAGLEELITQEEVLRQLINQN